MNERLLKKVQKLPDAPGVYLFKDARRKILYIGKATSLRERVRSYFASDLAETRGDLLVQMMEKAVGIEHIVTDSVLEALILEASLIRRYKPHHNTLEKDDKSYNFVLITKEDFPRILVMRGREVEQKYVSPDSYMALYGPFTNGTALRTAMKIIRRIFPYRDTCEPGAQKSCFNHQIGLCPGVCVGAISQKEYARTIKHLMMFFDGRKKDLLKSLTKDMKQYAKSQEFEKAAAVRRTVFALQHIQDVALIHRDKEVSGAHRLEAYDISHFAGTGTVGVMTVVQNGEALPAGYRMFRIRGAENGDDLASLSEVLTRRFTHTEWAFPELIIIDGGKTHMEHALRTLERINVHIPVVSVVKDEQHKPREILGDIALINKRQPDILLANSEAHRFAISYQKKVRGRKFFGVQ